MQHQVNYFSTLPEPYCSALTFIREFLIDEAGLTEKWKSHTPFFYFKGKWFAFLSYDPKSNDIYISFVKGSAINHPGLISNGRKQHRIYPVNPAADINKQELLQIINALKNLYN